MTAAASDGGGFEQAASTEQAEQWARAHHPLIRRGSSSVNYGYPASTPPATSSSTSSSPRPARAASRAGRQLARTRTSSRRTGYFDRAFSPAAAARRTGLGKISSGGDAGGLLLVLVIYPIVLATIRYGADGPGVWFKAKWLNQTDSSSTPGSSTPKTPTGPVNPHDPYTKNWTDTTGQWGPKGAFYPNSVFGSKKYRLGGKSYRNPHYVPGTKPKYENV